MSVPNLFSAPHRSAGQFAFSHVHLRSPVVKPLARIPGSTTPRRKKIRGRTLILESGGYYSYSGHSRLRERSRTGSSLTIEQQPLAPAEQFARVGPGRRFPSLL